MKTIDLKQHNIETYEKIKDAFKERNHIGTVQATGTGKSYIIAKAIQDSDANNVLFLAPSLHILNEFKENFKQSLNKNITFMTYKKLTFVQDLEGFLEENDFGFIILDEYHRCGAKTWGEAVKKLLNVYKDKKVLGTTATPVRFLDNCRDMTKELFDSEPVVDLSLHEAIERNILREPKYVLSYYDAEGTLELLNKKMSSIDNEKILSNMQYIINNVDSLINIEDVLKNNITTERKFIVFCSNVDNAKLMESVVSGWFKNIGFKTKTYCIYTDKENLSNQRKMELELKKFKVARPKDDKVHLLFSVNMLNEGVHIDGVDGLIFLRKSLSQIVVSQQLGRALSANDTKPPIVFDLVNNISELSERYIESFEMIGEKRGRNEKQDYSIYGNIKVYDYTADLNNLLKKISELNRLNQWEEFINSLLDFKLENGHCNVPSTHKLYKRCLSIKKQYSKNLLEEYQVNELNEIGFNWDYSIFNDELWNEMFNRLLEFIKKYGHANVPRSYEDQQLATWVHTQRKNESTMPIERKEKLLSVGFEFSLAQKRNDERWELMFKRLLEFKAKFNHVKVSSRDKDTELSNWVRSQRRAFKSGKLSPERYERLVEIGFDFLVA